MKTTCGIIILNEYNEIFSCHSTGNKHFDIPKGLIDDGESHIDCAIRECLEETSIIIDKTKLNDLGLFDYNKEKNIYLFKYFVEKKDIDLSNLVCNSFFENRYTKKQMPEVDYFEWNSLDKINEKFAKSMSKILTNILINSKSNNLSI